MLNLQRDKKNINNTSTTRTRETWEDPPLPQAGWQPCRRLDWLPSTWRPIGRKWEIQKNIAVE